jgi:hypothetical protein
VGAEDQTRSDAEQRYHVWCGDRAARGYADSDYAANPDKRRSTGGFVFLLAWGAISWGSKLLPTVATSIMEAEYMAHGNGVKKALWLRKLMETLYGAAGSTQLYCDSAGALAQIHNPVGQSTLMCCTTLCGSLWRTEKFR